MNYKRIFIKSFVFQAVFAVFAAFMLPDFGLVYSDVRVGVVSPEYEKLVITNISDITRRILLKSEAVYELSGNIRNVENSDFGVGTPHRAAIIESRYRMLSKSSGFAYPSSSNFEAYDSEAEDSGVKKFLILDKKNSEDFIKLYDGKYCEVYGKLSENFFGVSAATQLGAEFDEFIYPRLVKSFGKMYTPNEISSKIVLLCYDIDNDLGSTAHITSYRAGAFFPGDVASGYINSSGNNAWLLHLDTYPSMGFDRNRLCSNVDRVYSTLAHEFQHMLSFSHSYENTYPDAPLTEDLPDTWISEVLAEAAVYVYDGPQDYRIDDYNSSTVNGTSLIDFKGTLGDYSLAYLFGQYIRAQYGSSEVFGKILGKMTTNADYLEIICSLLNEKNGSNLSKEDLIFNFNVALQAKEKSGKFGFMGEPSFADIENKLLDIGTVDYVELAPLGSWTQRISNDQNLKFLKNSMESNPFYKIASVKNSGYIYTETQKVSSLEISAGSDVSIPPRGCSDNSVRFTAKVRDKFMNLIPSESCEFKMLGIKNGVSLSADGVLIVTAEADEGKIIIEAYHKTSAAYSRKEISLIKSNKVTVNQEVLDFVIPSVDYAREGQAVQLSIVAPPGMLPADDEVSVYCSSRVFKTNNLIFTMPGEDVELKTNFTELSSEVFRVAAQNGNLSFLKHLTPQKLRKENFEEKYSMSL